MPKFVSGSSGHIYAHNKSNRKNDDDDILLAGETDHKDSVKKPPAINKEGTKEKQKNILDLFKEELRKLHEERDEQRDKVKKSLKDNCSSGEQTNPRSSKPPPVPIPLKPDPRCPTTLTLQVNLNPKDRDSSMSGSYDTGDPNTTNLYLGNINPAVNENDLCDIFGKFGPLASIKIMWPRTDEERARNRNSGFVAYMSRIDAERALKALNGKDLRGYDMKMGWGKAVPIPQNPVYVPPELVKLTLPPPQSGLPFNGQLHQSDIDRGYNVPNPYPRPLPAELECDVNSNPDLKSIKEAYDEFIEVVGRSTVKVVLPADRSLLDRIHKTIEYVIKEGPVFEAIIIARENKNPKYSFLYDNQSQEHIYYRWRLYSTLHGDDPYNWRTEEFRMFENGPMWKPPPLNPYAAGMPIELIDKPVLEGAEVKSKKSIFLEGSLDKTIEESQLRGKFKHEMFGDILRNLDPTRIKIGAAMMYCINHADAAVKIIDCIYESLRLLETPFQKKIARLFLISDILHNCSAAVTNASYYRKGFQAKLISIFEHLREYLINIEDRYKADKFKQKVLSVLGAWKEWTLYEDEFVIELSNILLGLKKQENQICQNISMQQGAESEVKQKNQEDDLDGTELDDATLGECLEAKGLSLRWYKTLELSEDESDQVDGYSKSESRSTDRSPSSARSNIKFEASNSDRTVKFKTSKWETVDPDEVAGQVVTISKWESLPKVDDDLSGSTDSDESPDCDSTNDPGGTTTKRLKVENERVPSGT